MNELMTKFETLKAKINEHEKELSRLTGQVEMLEERLKNLGYVSVEEAKEGVEKTAIELEKKENELKDRVNSLFERIMGNASTD